MKHTHNPPPPSPPAPPPAAVSGDFSVEPQKCTPPPDLRDPSYHSPPRAATTSKTITTATITLTPPSPPRHHQAGAFYFIKHKGASGLSQHLQGRPRVRGLAVITMKGAVGLTGLAPLRARLVSVEAIGINKLGITTKGAFRCSSSRLLVSSDFGAFGLTVNATKGVCLELNSRGCGQFG
nr:hypothetical protein [Tanacetum cinerariifolium]